METPQRAGRRSRLATQIYTYCAFCIALWFLPSLAISYIVVRVCKHVWLKILSSRYPELEFIRTDTVRSLLDTHRNQGIINVLLSVRGPLDPELIREQLIEHVIERKDKNGRIMFPRLRHMLVSCWGNYAWKAKATFKPESHFIISHNVHRGRPVSDFNIQEYVSEIISKYFPSDQPPWQYIIIPCISSEAKYYILIRVHHLLLSGKDSINIGDLLLLEQLKQPDTLATQKEYPTKESSLTKLCLSPLALPELWQKISENLSNAWNEFISEYDPVESPRALKTLPGVFHVAGLMLISAVSALRDLKKKPSHERDMRCESPITATALIAAIQKECKRRNLTIPKMLTSPLVTIDPRKWPKKSLRVATAATKTAVRLPLQLYDEMKAFMELRNSNRVMYSDTMVWKYSGLVELSLRAGAELWRGVVEAYRAPANLWASTVGADDGTRHVLQTSSLCGRKVAAWSRPVSREAIERAARALDVSTSDISLFAATEALRVFFEHTQNGWPEHVLTTARAASEEFLFTFAEGDGKTFKKSQTGGMVCLSLPIGATPRRIASVVEEACRNQRALAGAWAAQARCGALTRAVPSPFARLTLNLLSRKYAVSYAEINAPASSHSRTTLWGQNVDGVIYWRPPQANISMSLTVIQYADSVRLAVMTDARLSPTHNIPAARWPAAVEQLVAKVDQQIAKAHQQIARQVTPLHTEYDTPAATQTDNVRANELSVDNDPSNEIEAPSPVAGASNPPRVKRRITHN